MYRYCISCESFSQFNSLPLTCYLDHLPPNFYFIFQRAGFGGLLDTIAFHYYAVPYPVKQQQGGNSMMAMMQRMMGGG